MSKPREELPKGELDEEAADRAAERLEAEGAYPPPLDYPPEFRRLIGLDR